MSQQFALFGSEASQEVEKKTFKVWQHARAADGKDEWLTPPEIIKSLGVFDLDPCAPVKRPWDMAKTHFTVENDGLKQEWFGRVFMNPPYSRDVLPTWLSRMSMQNNGIALIFARTETAAFDEYVWNAADSVLFLKGRLHFYDVNGVRADHNAGSPSCLVAYGYDNTEALRYCGLAGKLLPLNLRIFPVTLDFGSGTIRAHVGLPDFSRATWKDVVGYALKNLGGKGGLPDIYDVVAGAAIEKFKSNGAWRAQIRKVLQQHFTRVERGIWALPEAA